MVEAPGQRRRHIGRRLGFEAGNDTAPLSGNERQRHLAGAEMIVDRVEAALGLDGKVEIPIPVVLWRDRGARRANRQVKCAWLGDAEPVPSDADLGRESANRYRAVMIAAVDQQRDL